MPLVPAPDPETIPHDPVAEHAVVGSLLLEPGRYEAVALLLEPDDFFGQACRHVYATIGALARAGQAADVVTVHAFLERDGLAAAAGGMDFLVALVAGVGSPAHVEDVARLVRENAVRRRLIQAGAAIAALGARRDLDLAAALGQAETTLRALAAPAAGGGFVPLADLLQGLLATLDERTQAADAGLAGGRLRTGFLAIDEIVGGFAPTDLVILGARPATGKSAVALGVARNVAAAGRPVAFFSLEMAAVQLAERLLAAEARVDGPRLAAGTLSQGEWEALVAAVGRLSDLPFYVDDDGLCTPELVEHKVRAFARREAPGLVVVDHLGLMRAGRPGREANRVQEVSQISRALKLLARDVPVPILALSQLSRGVESRDDRRPRLADLRDSGCLAGESRVFLPDTGEHVPIRSLVGRSGFRVAALDVATWRLEPRVVTAAFSTGTKPVYRLRTARGRVLRATGNHPVRTLAAWRRLDELVPGDRIAAPRRLEAATAGGEAAHRLALLGHLVGDGCTLPHHVVQYTTKDADLAALVAELAGRSFGDALRPRVVLEHDRRRDRSWFQVYLPATGHLTHGRSNPIAAWLRDLGVFGLRSWEKRVPDAVFRQGADGVATFLRHLWATDGCVVAGGAGRGPALGYATASAALARDVQDLLLHLGIAALRRAVPASAKGRTQYQLVVSDHGDVRRFSERVGVAGARKQASLALAAAALSPGDGCPNSDTLPREVWPLVLRPAMGALGMTTRGLAAASGRAYNGTAVQRPGLSRARAARLAGLTRSPALANLATSDVYWDRVVAVEPDGEEEVFDLTVEGLHNFVADGLIVHNSVEQDADTVLLLYRDEMYDPESADRGLAELIVAKHRHGPTGKGLLAWDARFAAFRDLRAQEPPPPDLAMLPGGTDWEV